MIDGVAKGTGEAKERNLNKQVERPIVVITYRELNETVRIIIDAVKEQTSGQKVGIFRRNCLRFT